jgi:DNA-binding NarL/FixJ family response regulator
MMYVIYGANFQISNSFGGEIGRNQSMGTTRVVLADDHPIVRAGIRRLLEKAADIQVVGEASDGIEALHLVEDLDPDVLLLDVEMPGLRGTEVARRLQVAGSPVHILALSSYDDEQYIRGMLASGAAGYLTKEEAPQTLVHAVRRVARGEQGRISQRVAAHMADWGQEKTSMGISLTDQEKEVLRLVVAGKTNHEIGKALGLSEKKVEQHLQVVLAKLEVDSRTEAAMRAVQEGLV